MSLSSATSKAENITVETVSGEDVVIHLAANFKDPIYEITKQCTHGAYAIDPKSGHLQYRSDDNFIGTDHITYIAKNGDEESIPGDVVIAVLNKDEVEKVMEITIDIPVKPTQKDLVEAVIEFAASLDELVNGKHSHDDNDEDDD